MLIPPKYAVREAVEVIKSNTSRALKLKFPFLQKVYWDERGIWSPGYFVLTIGIDEKSIIRYVQFQQRQDLGQAKLIGF